jgi:hypothetical protein
MIELLLVVLALLQVGDGLTTYCILSRGGRELNPVMAKIFAIVGIIPGLILKGVAVVIVGYFCGQASIVPLLIIISGYILVVLWNLYQIFKK